MNRRGLGGGRAGGGGGAQRRAGHQLPGPYRRGHNNDTNKQLNRQIN